MKLCLKCKQLKPITQFYRRPDRKSPGSSCKSCERDRRKVYYRKNKKEILAKSKEYAKKIYGDDLKITGVDNQLFIMFHIKSMTTIILSRKTYSTALAFATKLKIKMKWKHMPFVVLYDEAIGPVAITYPGPHQPLRLYENNLDEEHWRKNTFDRRDFL